MKILVFTDVHEKNKFIDILIKKAKQVDLLVCCGDLSWFGHSLENMVKKLSKTGKKMLLIPGNHESKQEIEYLCGKYSYLVNLHKKSYVSDDVIFFGYGNLGFSLVEPLFEKLVPSFKKKIKEGQKIVFVTHGPPFGTKLDYLPFFEHVGCKSFNKFIKDVKPNYYFCGHLHENFGVKDIIGKTKIINPGPEGMVFEI